AIVSSHHHRCVFFDMPSLVRVMRSSQPGVLPRFHYRAQFQTLSDAGISAYSTILVLPADYDHGAFAMDILAGLVRQSRSEEGRGRISANANIVYGCLGRLPCSVFFVIEIQAAWLHSSGGISAGFCDFNSGHAHAEIPACVGAIRS